MLMSDRCQKLSKSPVLHSTTRISGKITAGVVAVVGVGVVVVVVLTSSVNVACANIHIEGRGGSHQVDEPSIAAAVVSLITSPTTLFLFMRGGSLPLLSPDPLGIESRCHCC